MKKKVVIIGGDINGLLCGYLFRKYNVDVVVIEDGQVAREFIHGGLEYVYNTEPITAILDELKMEYSGFPIRGGIMLREQVLRYPACFKDKKTTGVNRIKLDYFRKTRRVNSLVKNTKKAISDLLDTTRSRRAVRTDCEELVAKLSSSLNFVRATPMMLSENSVLTTKGRIEFDFLVFTRPLWELRNLVHWEVPRCVAIRLGMAFVVPLGYPYSAWDYVLTPYTPANRIHRFFPFETGFKAEFSGGTNMYELQSDLNFIFKKGWYLQGVRDDFVGYLLPLTSKINWPHRFAPLGRLAKWDQKTTLDSTLVEVIELARKWFK